MTNNCPNCGGDIAIRNPTGHCDHLYYPENVPILTMATHELKIWPEHYEPFLIGKKRAEYRKNDRNFRVGDTVWLREYQPETGAYTGRDFYADVTHVATGDHIPKGYALLSLVESGREKEGQRPALVAEYSKMARKAIMNKKFSLAKLYMSEAAKISLSELREYIKESPELQEVLTQKEPELAKPKGFFSSLFSIFR